MGEMGFCRCIEEGHHGAFEGLRATGGFVFRCKEHPRGEGLRRLTQNRPVGDQNRTCPGIEEGFCKARWSLRTGGAVRGRRIAGRQDDPVGIKLQLSNLICRQKPVILIGPLYRRTEHKTGFRETLEFSGNETTG